MSIEQIFEQSIDYHCACKICAMIRKLAYTSMRSEMRIRQAEIEQMKEIAKSPELTDHEKSVLGINSEKPKENLEKS